LLEQPSHRLLFRRGDVAFLLFAINDNEQNNSMIQERSVANAEAAGLAGSSSSETHFPQAAGSGYHRSNSWIADQFPLQPRQILIIQTQFLPCRVERVCMNKRHPLPNWRHGAIPNADDTM